MIYSDRGNPSTFESAQEVFEWTQGQRILHLRADRLGGSLKYNVVVEDRESPSMKRALLPSIRDPEIAAEVSRLASTGTEAPLF